MGAADVVPGVSGGTIAFISGIYEELITSLNNINLGLLKIWREEGFKAAWKKLNGNFLLALFIGILVSVMISNIHRHACRGLCSMMETSCRAACEMQHAGRHARDR